MQKNYIGKCGRENKYKNKSDENMNGKKKGNRGRKKRSKRDMKERKDWRKDMP